MRLKLAVTTLGMLIALSAYAGSGDIIITREMIRSQDICPVQATEQLRCEPYHQTTNYTCGPASVMTLMRYYGKLDARSMNKATEMRIASEMNAIPGAGGGTTKKQVANWLSSHGFSVDTGKNITTDMIITNIQKRIPTIVSFNNHWMVAKGYQKASDSQNHQDQIIFADSCCNVSLLSREIIDTTWQTQRINRKKCSDDGEYIVAVPE